MTKTEYLNALKNALKNTDESIMEEIVMDYEEHFQAGMENGKSEEQICEDLGSIEDLVEEIKEVYHTDHQNEKKEENKSEEDQTNNKNNKFKDWYSDIHNIDTEKIGGVINSALDSAGDAISKIDVNEISRTLKSTLDQATTSINSFADNYLKNQGAGPFEFNKRSAKGYQENVSKSFDESEEPEDEGKSNVSYDAGTEAETENQDAVAEAPEPIVEAAQKEQEVEEKSVEEDNQNNSKGLNLSVDGICADIFVGKSSNGKININYENNGNDRQKQMYEFYSYKEGNTVYAGIRRVGKAVFVFNLKMNSINIFVELPDQMGDVNIRTASGNIAISDVKADRMTATAASGDVEINRVYTTDLRIKGSSGDIKLEDINSVELTAGTMSGDISANNVESKFLSLRSSSGDVESRHIVADIIDNGSLSGDLEMMDIKTGECKIRSTSGDIDMKEFTMNNADISCVSGDINLARVLGDGLRVSSSSGKVVAELNVKRCHAGSRSGDVDVFCNGDIKLEASSTSGDVDVTLKNYNNGYNINSRTTSGALYINYDNNHQRNLKTGTYTYGNQGSELSLSSVSGDIHVAD